MYDVCATLEGGRMRTALLYAQVVVLTGVVLTFAFDLKRANLHIPFYYSAGGGDLFFYLPLYKAIAETGWYTENPSLGAPSVMRLYDFPINETGLMLGVKLLIALVGDPFLAANLYFLLTFVTAAIAALFVLRVIGVDSQVAVTTSLLFAFLPYHFWRGPFHPFASTYHAIPLLTLVALYLSGNKPIFFHRDVCGHLRWNWSRRFTLPVLVTCVLASISGPYFAFFGTFLILTGGVIGLVRKPGVERILDALLAAGLVAGLFAVQLIPNGLYRIREGANPMPLKRETGYYYHYSLRIVNLLRPVPGHRIAQLNHSLPAERVKSPPDLAWLYNETNESEVSSPLGALGALGFLALIAFAVAAPFALLGPAPVIGDLAQLNLAVLLLGLNGGFGELLALYVTTMIRCYNRISIFIGFFSLAALALLVSRRRCAIEPGPAMSRGRIGWGWLVVLWFLTALGLLDQIPPLLVPDHVRDAAAFQSDKEFIAAVEKALPPGSMVFQLPQHTFPEFGRRSQMYDYSHFRGYLHSHRLRWSYGAVRGREAEVHGLLALQSPPKLIDTLISAGFAGVYINRKGYGAGDQELIRAILRRVPQAPIANRDGSLLLFRLPVESALPQPE
jgi:phosphoglycerol transferase